jgi:hypothetical protein
MKRGSDALFYHLELIEPWVQQALAILTIRAILEF